MSCLSTELSGLLVWDHSTGDPSDIELFFIPLHPSNLWRHYVQYITILYQMKTSPLEPTAHRSWSTSCAFDPPDSFKSEKTQSSSSFYGRKSWTIKLLLKFCSAHSSIIEPWHPHKGVSIPVVPAHREATPGQHRSIPLALNPPQVCSAHFPSLHSQVLSRWSWMCRRRSR